MGQPCSLTLFSHLGNGDDTSSLSNSYVQLPTRMFHGNGPSNPEAENTISTCHWVGEEAFQEGGVSCPADKSGCAFQETAGVPGPEKVLSQRLLSQFHESRGECQGGLPGGGGA